MYDNHPTHMLATLRQWRALGTTFFVAERLDVTGCKTGYVWVVL